jgi:ribosomal-protein-alanine N-acetyltransferase
MQSNFTTARLNLSSLTTEKNEFILELVNTEGWLRFIGDRNIRTIDDATAYIDKINQNAIFKYWVVELKEDKTPIGIITLIKRDYLEFHDIGFAFLPAYSKKGYAFEAASSILNYLVNDGIADHLLATTIPDNVNSIWLLTKLGFQPDREIEVDGEKLAVYGFKKNP